MWTSGFFYPDVFFSTRKQKQTHSTYLTSAAQWLSLEGKTRDRRVACSSRRSHCIVSLDKTFYPLLSTS